MASLTPVAWADIDRLRTFRHLAEESVQRWAGFATRSDLIFRDLRPTDVYGPGTVTAAFSTGALTANTLAVDAIPRPNFVLTSTQAVVIYGIALVTTNPILREIQFGLTSGLFDIIEVGALLAEQRPIGLIDPFIGYKPNEHPVINLLAAAAGTDEFMLLGTIAEQAEATVLTPRDLTGGQ